VGEVTWQRWSLRSQVHNPITAGYQDKPGKLTSLRRWCQSYFGLITTRSTVNVPWRLGDQSRRIGWIRSRKTNVIVEGLWSNWCFRWFMTKVNEEKIAQHATVKPPDKQSSNNNSNCSKKRSNHKYFTSVEIFALLFKYTIIKVWNSTPRRCCKLNWFLNSIPVEMYWHQIFTSSFPCQLK
jgi:hypothetical protein